MTRAAILTLALLALFDTASAADTKPNILFILTDNLGYGEVGVYGGGITRGAPTPRIDSLAREGLRLTNMNMETQCTPSRSSLMTGRFAIRSGTYAVPFGGVPEGLTQWEVTIAESLSAVGYATALHGKWHLACSVFRATSGSYSPPWIGSFADSSSGTSRTICFEPGPTGDHSGRRPGQRCRLQDVARPVRANRVAG